MRAPARALPSAAGLAVALLLVLTRLSGAAAQSLAYVNRSLLVDLRAADFNNATGQWDNRATPGAFSATANGDFVAVSQGGKAPYLKYLDFGTGAGAIPVVWFPPGAGRVQSLSTASPLAGAGVYNTGNAGTGDFSLEAWAWNNGSEVGGEAPVFQWGQRGTTAQAAYLSMGSHPNYGAGSFFGSAFDVPWAAGNTTEAGPAGGQRPRANEWHHLVMTYTGNPPNVGPSGGLQAGTLALYLDGALNRVVTFSAALAIVRSGNFSVGQYVSAAGALTVPTFGLMVAALRLHDGALAPDEVAYNYALDAAYYRGGGAAAGATGVSPLPTPSPSATPGGARCPTAWAAAAATHALRTISLSNANDTTAYARHCAFWWYWTSSFPVTDTAAAGDASQILRSGVDGTPGTYSLQSANYPGYYLVPRPDGYLQYSFYATTIGIAARNRSAATWYFDALADGSGAFQMRSRAPGMVDWVVSEDRTVPTLHACNAYSPNLRAYPPSLGYPPARFAMTDSLMLPAALSPLVFKSERVVVESLAAPRLGSVVSQCGGRAIVNNDGGLANAAGAFTLVPPLACAAVCGTNAFSLRFGSFSRYLTVPPLAGTTPVPLQVIDPTSAAYSDDGASFIGVRATVSGVTGWVLYPASGYAGGWVLQREATAASCVDTACCLAATNATALVAAPVPAGGLTLAHLWSLKWEDSPTELTALPATSYTAPACAASASPVASTTAANTVSTSVSPAPSNTPSGTASPSGTQLYSLSPAATPTASGSGTPPPTGSPTQSVAPTPSAASTQSASLTPTGSASSSATPTPTASASSSASPSLTASASASALSPPSESATAPATPTRTPLSTGTSTRTRTATGSTTVSATNSLSPAALQCALPGGDVLTATGALTGQLAATTAGISLGWNVSCAGRTSTGAVTTVNMTMGAKIVVKVDLSAYPVGGLLSLSTCGVAVNNTRLYVGTDCPTSPAAFNCVLSNDDRCGTQSQVNITNTTRAVYYVVVEASTTTLNVTSGLRWLYVLPAQSSTATASGTATASFGSSPSPSVTTPASPSVTRTGSPTGTSTGSSTGTYTGSSTRTATTSFGSSPSPSGTATGSTSGTRSTTSTATGTRSPTGTSTGTASPSEPPQTASTSPSLTPSPSQTPSFTPSPSQTPSFTPSPSQTPSFTQSPSQTPSFTPSSSQTPSITPSISFSRSGTASRSRTPSQTPTVPVCPPPGAVVLQATGALSGQLAATTANVSLGWTSTAACAGRTSTGTATTYSPYTTNPKIVVRVDLSAYPIGGLLSVSTCGMTSTDSRLYVGTGCPGSAATFGCVQSNDDRCGAQSQVNITATSQAVYYAVIEAYTSLSAITSGFKWLYVLPSPMATPPPSGTPSPSFGSTPSTTVTPSYTPPSSTDAASAMPTGSATASATATPSGTGSPFGSVSGMSGTLTSTRSGSTSGSATGSPSQSATGMLSGTAPPATTPTTSGSGTPSGTPSVSPLASFSSSPSGTPVAERPSPTPSASQGRAAGTVLTASGAYSGQFTTGAGGTTTFSFQVADSTLPVQLTFDDYKMGAIAGIGGSGSRYQWRLGVTVNASELVDPTTGSSLCCTGSPCVCRTYNIVSGGNADAVWTAKQAQGYGQSASWFYFRVGCLNSLYTCTYRLKVAFLLASPSASPPPTQSGSGSGSATGSPSQSATGTLSSTAPPITTPTGTLTGPPPGAPSGTGSATASPSTTASGLRSAFVSASPTPVTIAGWTFDGSSTAASLGPAAAGATLTVLSPHTPAITVTYFANGAGLALGLASFPASGSNASAGVEFCASSLGYVPVSVYVDHRASNTASKWRVLQYRTAAGGPWVGVATVASSQANVGANYDAFSMALPGDAALANAPGLCFRYVSMFGPNTDAYAPARDGSAYGTGGTWRLDNLAVRGWPTEQPSSSTTPSVTLSASLSSTGVPTDTALPSATASISFGASASSSASTTGTPSGTPSSSQSAPLSPTASASGSASPSLTASASTSALSPPSESVTAPATPTRTASSTGTSTRTRTATGSTTASVTNSLSPAALQCALPGGDVLTATGALTGQLAATTAGIGLGWNVSCAGRTSTGAVTTVNMTMGPKIVVKVDLTGYPVGGLLSVSTCGVAVNNTRLYVGTDCPTSPAAFNCLLSNDDRCGSQSQVNITNTTRAVYYAVVEASTTTLNVTSGLRWLYVLPAQSSTATASGTATASFGSSPSSTVTPGSLSATRTGSPTGTSTGSSTRTATTSFGSSPSPTPTATGSLTPTRSFTGSANVTRSTTGTTTGTRSTTSTATSTRSPTGTSTGTASPSETPQTASTSPSSTPSPSQTPSFTPSPSQTPSFTPSPSQTPSFTPSSSQTPSFTPSPSQTPSITPSSSQTPSITPSISFSRSGTASRSRTPSQTPSVPVCPPPGAVVLHATGALSGQLAATAANVSLTLNVTCPGRTSTGGATTYSPYKTNPKIVVRVDLSAYPIGGLLSVSTCGMTTADSRLFVGTGCPGSATFGCVLSNDDRCGTQSQVNITNTTLPVYYAVVEAYTSTAAITSGFKWLYVLPTPSSTPTASPVSATGSPSASVTPSPSGTGSPSPSFSATPSKSPRPTGTPTRTVKPTGTPTASGTRTADPTASPPPSSSDTPSVSATPSASASLSGTPTGSLSPGGTPSATPPETPSASVTPTGSLTPSASSTASGTGSGTGTPSPSQTGTPSTSLSRTPARSATSTVTAASTGTATPSYTPTATASVTDGATGSATGTPSLTPSNTPAAIPDAAVLLGLALPGAGCESFATTAALGAALRCALSLSIPMPLDQVRLAGATCENGTVITFTDDDAVNTAVAPACEAGQASSVRRRALRAAAPAGAAKVPVASLSELGPGRALRVPAAPLLLALPGSRSSSGDRRRLASSSSSAASAELELVIPPPEGSVSLSEARSAQQGAASEVLDRLSESQAVADVGDSSPLMDDLSRAGFLDAYANATGGGTLEELVVGQAQVDVPSGTPTKTASGTASVSATGTRSASATGTPSPSGSGSSSSSGSASPSQSGSSSRTATASSSLTATPSSSDSASSSLTATPTPSQSGTRSPSRTGTATQSGTASASQSGTRSPSRTGTATQSGTASASQSGTRSPSRTGTATQSGTASASQSGTRSPSRTGSATQSGTASASQSMTGSQSGTQSLSGTGSLSQSGSPSQTGSPSLPPTASGSGTPPLPPTASGSRSRSPSPSRTLSPSSSPPICPRLPAVVPLSGTSGTSPALSTAAAAGSPDMYAPGSCASGLKTFWPGRRLVYVLTLGASAPLGGTLTLTTCGQTSNDTVLYVGTGCPTSYWTFSCRAGSDNDGCASNAKASTVTLPAVSQRSYFIQLGGAGGANVTSGLKWAYAPPPSPTTTVTRSRVRSPPPSASRTATRSRSRKGK